MSIEHKSCCSTLDHLDLVDVSGSVGVPDWSSIFKKRSDKGKVCLGFQLNRVDSQVPPQEGQGGVGFVTDVPSQI